MTTATEIPHGQLFRLERGKDYVLAIRCGRCGDQVAFYAPDRRHSPAACRAKLRDMGWRWRGKRGWICEVCEHKRSQHEDARLNDWDAADDLT